MTNRYTVRRINNSLCELAYTTPGRVRASTIVRYTRPDAGGYVLRNGQQALEQGPGRSGHALYCGAGQNLATLIRSEVRKSLAREQRELDESRYTNSFVATLDEAGAP